MINVSHTNLKRKNKSCEGVFDSDFKLSEHRTFMEFFFSDDFALGGSCYL